MIFHWLWHFYLESHSFFMAMFKVILETIFSAAFVSMTPCIFFTILTICFKLGGVSGYIWMSLFSHKKERDEKWVSRICKPKINTPTSSKNSHNSTSVQMHFSISPPSSLCSLWSLDNLGDWDTKKPNWFNFTLCYMDLSTWVMCRYVSKCQIHHPSNS